jgi:chromate reductase
MRILIISGSARRDSLNTRLARLAANTLAPDAATVISDLDRVPYYNGDVEAAGLPAPVVELREAVAEADTLVIVTPEYNGTVPGLLGNAVDWLSRPPDDSVLRRKRVVVLSASPSRYGGIRAATHLRTVLGHIGADVVPEGLSVARAHQRLDEQSADPDLISKLTEILHDALQPASAADRDTLALAA